MAGAINNTGGVHGASGESDVTNYASVKQMQAAANQIEQVFAEGPQNFGVAWSQSQVNTLVENLQFVAHFLQFYQNKANKLHPHEHQFFGNEAINGVAQIINAMSLSLGGGSDSDGIAYFTQALQLPTGISMDKFVSHYLNSNGANSKGSPVLTMLKSMFGNLGNSTTINNPPMMLSPSPANDGIYINVFLDIYEAVSDGNTQNPSLEAAGLMLAQSGPLNLVLQNTLHMALLSSSNQKTIQTLLGLLNSPVSDKNIQKFQQYLVKFYNENR
ncbi:MAG: hypothetical protein P0S95_03150 [Rhabdochlamydiaceae bacterium]|nr:hypothetical protein [Candidatus Amphrikana amoebophyrae]